MALRALLCALAAAARPVVVKAELTVLAIGDWGGGSDEEPTTESQRLTAAGMLRAAQDNPPNFALLMGDNFYEHGIHECAAKTPRFHETFEEVYASLLPDLPFYALAGNHDYGEGRLANISAQLEYSKLSKHWRFPSLWYKIQREFTAENKTRTLEVLVLDTVVLCGNGQVNEAFVDEQLRALGRKATRREEKPGDLRKDVAEEHWAWLEAELANSTADFLWVTGHFPIWSAGSDGSTSCLIERLRPLLMEHGAHYISGHDHMLEHFEQEGLNTFVVGAGKECCYPPKNLRTTPPGAIRYMLAGEHGQLSRPPVPFPVQGGFASLRFGAEVVRVSLLSDNGTVLYEAPPISRRGRAAVGAIVSFDGVIARGLRWPSEAAPLLGVLLLALFAGAALLRVRARRTISPKSESAQPLLA